MAELIDGRALARRLDESTKAEVAAQLSQGHDAPGLAVVLVGADPASEVYVAHKIKACARVGIESYEHRLPEGTSQDALLALIARPRPGKDPAREKEKERKNAGEVRASPNVTLSTQSGNQRPTAKPAGFCSGTLPLP